ncbi:hypothetical protein MKW94_025888 [Papaver nudicaule]|uniref:protein-serine/threonine phosphatase n=1 Tax=Papaver nudicaule TaxID=74823 RepID=A0AA41S428_PAPNU|nr:hypothetical protein [Papaver nudicaule]
MSIAVANSPVFSPSRGVSSIFSKTHSSSSPRRLSSPSQSPCSSPCRRQSSSSPFRLKLQKSPIGGGGLGLLRVCSNSSNKDGVVNSVTSPVLKRKRPPMMISIPPVVSLSFDAESRDGEAAAAAMETEVEREGYGVYCKKGRRAAMEDRYSAVLDLQGDTKQGFFGVFDGHGGAKAAEFAAENLEKYILSEVTRRGGEEIVEAVKDGYLSTDSEFLKEDLRGGTCCVTALIRKGDLIVSNAGDCRAVMSRGGIAQALTSDHRPSREDEKERIESKGGYVDFCHGVLRLQGSLAVSRGIGDRHLKEWVIAEPETKVLRIEPDCEFLLLASDGLWDKVTNQEAVDMARPFCVDTMKATPLSACKKLAELAISRGSVDDISVMIIQLERFV